MSAVVAQQTDVIKHASPVKVEKFNGTTFLTTKNYFDGLGRPVQSIDVGASAQNGKDVVSFVVYDNMSRGDATTYLPYVSASNNGAKVANPIAQQQTYYQSLLPATDPDRNYTYARKQYDNSPLGLVLKQGSVGASNSFDGKPVQYEYKLNGSSDQIKELRVDNSGNLRFKGYYPANSLSVHRSLVSSSTGDGHDTYEYVNSLGQAIASETRVSGSDRRITYYVYDDFSRLRYTIPSALESAITSTTYAYTPFDLKKYSYYTQYDERNRPIAEWFPGYGRTYYVYDVLNRVVLTQTNKLSQTNESAFVKYDSQNRPVMSGVIALGGSIGTIDLQSRMSASGVDGLSRSADMTLELDTDSLARIRIAAASMERLKAIQDSLNSSAQNNGMVRTMSTTSAPNTGILFESRGAALHGYTNQAYPTNVKESDIWNVTYYDDYDWITNTTTYGFSLADTLGVLKTTNSVTGLTTGTKTKIIGQSLPQWLTSVTYYDDNYNAIQTISDLWPAGKEIVSNAHNFNGQVTRTKVKQIVDNVTYEYNKWFDYDGYGRLLKVRQKITGDAQGEVVLAEYAYDDLGRVASKKIHNGKETTTYAYDIAGRNIATTSPSFSYKLGFDKSLIPNVAGRSDGLISQVTWSNSATGDQKAYAYTYDALKQYTSASFYEKPGATWTASTKYKETIGGYDRAGNILSIQRTNASGAALHNFTMAYTDGSNGYTLMSVNGSAGFQYDANANMTKDGLSGVQIIYNDLDLPGRIYNGSEFNSYIYNARGEKIASSTNAGNNSTYYRSVMVYSKAGSAAQQLSYMLHPEGLVVKEGSAWVYKYFKTDHLGNTRALLAVRNGNLVNEGQNTDYYPYGIAHSTNNLHLNKYLFGGKEYQEGSVASSMLELYDFGARFYNPTYGRWFNMDPARQFENPFTYCGNNPVVFIDPNGEDAYYMDAEGYVEQRYPGYGPNPFPDYPEFYDFLARTPNRDMLYTYDSYGNYHMTFVDDTGFLKNFSREKRHEGGGGDGYYNYGTTSNAGDAFNVFKFGADYSKVEWGLNGYSTSLGYQFLVRTSHSEESVIVTDGPYNERDMRFDIHSHPDTKKKGASGEYWEFRDNWYATYDLKVAGGRFARITPDGSIPVNKLPNHYVYVPDNREMYHYMHNNNNTKSFRITDTKSMQNYVVNKNYNTYK